MTEAKLLEDIPLTIFCAARPGFDEDAWQVEVERGGTVCNIKDRIAALYGMPRHAQVLRRDIDSAPLPDAEPHGCDEGDVLHLSAVQPADLFGSLLGGLTGTGTAGGGQPDPLGAGLAPLAGLAEMLANQAMMAMTEAGEAERALEESLAGVEYKLTFVRPTPAPERRCQLPVGALARVCQVLDMARLEVGAEGEALALEFCGETLPADASVHSLGLREGDIVMVVSAGEPTPAN